MRRAKHIKKTRSMLYGVTLTVMVLFGLALFAGEFGLGGLRVFTVQSGSMDPAIERNSLVLTLPASSPEVNDVITFQAPEQPDILITHRIVEVDEIDDQTTYTTKGDANEAADDDPLPTGNIIGKVWLVVPWFGVIINWLRTDIGFIILIIIPATIFIYQELLNLRQQFRDRRAKQPVASST